LYFTADDGYAGRYDKIHLGPGTERQPGLGRWLESVAGDFLSLKPTVVVLANPDGGKHVSAFLLQRGTANSWRFGVSICADVLYPSFFPRYHEERHAQSLPAFFLNCADESPALAGHYHHLAFACAQFRAIEARRPIVRSVLAGVSGAVDSCGRAVDVESNGQLLMLDAIPLDDRRSIYMQTGDVLSKVCAGLTAALVAISLPIRRRSSVATRIASAEQVPPSEQSRSR